MQQHRAVRVGVSVICLAAGAPVITSELQAAQRAEGGKGAVLEASTNDGC